MDPVEQERRFKAAVAELGLSATDAAALGQQLVETEKAAQAAGVAFKSQEHIPVYVAPDGTPGIIQDGAWVALKAAAPEADDGAADDVDVAMMAEDDPAGDDAPEMEDDGGGEYVGDMAPEAFTALMTQAITSALDPLIKQLNIADKMAGHMAELKTMFSGQTAKEAGVLAALSDRITALEGDAPAVGLSADAAAALKSTGPAAPEQPAPAFLTDPSRPLAGAAAELFPEIYAPGAALQYGPGGWQGAPPTE